jgi:RNA polymerase sigma-70 factor (ECF subfamily)
MAEGADDTLDAYLDDRDRLFGLAYRMTGSVADAEDVVQEVWVRWNAADRSAIVTPAAWLTTVTTRLTLDRLRSAQHRRETYVGPWLPEPLPVPGSDPGEVVERSETLTLGFLCALDRLDPRERAAFLLHDVFGRPFDEIADTLGVSAANARQIASRARRRVRDEDRAGRSSPEEADRLVDAFLEAVLAGDEDRLAGLLAADVVAVSDGGPDQHAARRPVVGVDRVTRYAINMARRIVEGAAVERTWANASPALIARDHGGQGALVVVFEVGDGRITAIRSVLNPHKLGHIA